MTTKKKEKAEHRGDSKKKTSTVKSPSTHSVGGCFFFLFSFWVLHADTLRLRFGGAVNGLAFTANVSFLLSTSEMATSMALESVPSLVHVLAPRLLHAALERVPVGTRLHRHHLPPLQRHLVRVLDRRGHLVVPVDLLLDDLRLESRLSVWMRNRLL